MKKITLDGMTIEVDGEIESIVIKDHKVKIKVAPEVVEKKVEVIVYKDQYYTQPYYPYRQFPVTPYDPMYPPITWAGSGTQNITNDGSITVTNGDSMKVDNTAVYVSDGSMQSCPTLLQEVK